MSVKRRKFLKLAGLTAFGLASGTPTKLLADGNALPDLAEVKSTGVLGKVKRLAMVIDIRKCQQVDNCSACSDACHLIHNVPDFEDPKDEVKWIWKESFDHVFHDQGHEHLEEALKHAPIPVLCNHCDEPACVKVCPTGATFKREEDGIVMMDWHRCIGCRYCMAACPYGSRSFNWRDPRGEALPDEKIQPGFPTRMRGVVEKCTFCEELLARDPEQKPACVTACEAGAMVFGDLNDENSDVRKLLAERFSIRRKPGLGTEPEVYYLL